MMSERYTQKSLPGFTEEAPAPTLTEVETDRATHVIAKGKVVYFPHSEEAFTTRKPFYVRYVSQSDRQGWAWYQTMGPVTLWREKIHEFKEPIKILVGPKSAIKR